MVLFARSLSTALAALAALVALPAAAADIPPEPGVTWEQTVQFEAKGMPMKMPAQTQTVCVPRKEWREPPRSERDSEHCKVKDFKRSGNRYTWKMVCDDGEMKGGEAEVVRSPGGDSYDGKMTMQTARMGEMTSTFHGKLIGQPCDAAATKRQASEIQARVAEAQAQQEQFKAGVCEQGLQTMNPMYFTQLGMCTDPAKKAQFCKKAQTRAGYVKLTSEDPQLPKKADELCDIDLAAVRAKACKETLPEVMVDEPAEEDADFLLRQCPAESQKVAKVKCAGRKFTGMHPSLQPICIKYAQEEMEARRKPAPEAEPKPASVKDDAVQEGKKALKGLLGW